MPLWPATKPVMRSCICSNQRMVWGTPRIMPEWRTGCTVMVAVGHDKAAPGADCQRDADGVAPAQHDRGHWAFEMLGN